MNRTDLRAALLLAANVLGVGAFFLPWTARAAYGEAAVAGWLYLVIAGGLLVFALARAAALPGAGQGAAALVGRSLGEPFGRAVRAFYAVGVTAGQVVVALVAAGFLAQAVGTGGRAHWWVAALVIAAGTAGAATGKRVLAGPSLPLFAAVLALLFASALLSHGGGTVPQVSDTRLDWRLSLSAAVLQLFVVVGWESTPGVLGAAGARRARGPVLGVVLVAVVYTAVLVVAGSVGAVEAAPGLVLPDLGPGAGRVVSLLVALVAVLFCTRNLSTAAGLAVEALTGAPATVDTLRRSALAVGAVALLGTALVVREWLGATDVLSVPDAMALVVFLGVSASAALARRRQDVGMTGGVRAGTVALAAHLPLSFFAGPALALPLLLLGAFTGRAPPRTAGPTDDAEEFHTFGELTARHEKAGRRYLEFLRTRSLSAGLYVVPAGTPDPQQPSAEDELYVVVGGRGALWTGDGSQPVGPGSVVHVPAGLLHRFTDITEDLHTLVVFAPPESSPSPDDATRGERSRR
jgi:mannose-6-phosphate isomerase-like protein (cupin superfamily)